jgi:hypothetical protein
MGSADWTWKDVRSVSLNAENPAVARDSTVLTLQLPLGIALAVKTLAHVLINKADKGLYSVQEGLNLR